MELKYIDIKEFEEVVYSYYLDIFPEEERKPLELIQSSYKRKVTQIIKIIYKNKFIGFMLINKIKDKGYAVLDYLAILPQYRNNGFGTKALKKLLKKEKESRGIFVEVEKIGLGENLGENLVRERRKKFYEELGFRKLNFDILLFNVVYMPYVFSNNQDKEEIIIEEILDIYKSISGQDRINKNCKIISKK